MSKSLQEIRQTIDTLDNQIHDLLMERASLIVDICAEKRKHNKPVVQPAREAMMIRRLLGRHKGLLPQAAIVGIWRELVGAVCMLQKGLRIQVSAGKNEEYCWDMAKDYFGSVLPMNRVTGPTQAISAVHEDDANIAVVPWPLDGDKKPWWVSLVNQDMNAAKMRIVCALPYGNTDYLELTPKKSLVIAKIDFAPSGEDHSFIAIELDNSVSRARIMETLKKHDLEAVGIASKDTKNRVTHLIEVDDFVGEDDPRLATITEIFEANNARCLSLGGYPIPPVFPKGDTDPVKAET